MTDSFFDASTFNTFGQLCPLAIGFGWRASKLCLSAYRPGLKARKPSQEGIDVVKLTIGVLTD